MTTKPFWLSLFLACASLSNAQWVDSGGPADVSVLTTGDIVWGGDVGMRSTIAVRGGWFFYPIFTGRLGDDWQQHAARVPDTNITAVATLRYYIFAGARDNGVYRAGGAPSSPWAVVNAGLTNRRVTSLAVVDTNVFAGTEGGVFRTANSGAAWTAASGGLADTNIRALWASGGLLAAGGATGGVFVSTSRGVNWSSASTGLPAGKSIRALAGIGRALFASVAGAGLYRSSDTGASWVASGTGLPDTVVRCFAVAGGALLAGTNQGVFFSADTGKSWTGVNTGLPNAIVYGVTVTDAGVFAGMADGVWYRPLSQITTSIHGKVDPSRAAVRIDGARRVMIHVTRATRVVVNAYGADGRFAATVLDETFPAGSFSRPLATSGLPQGVYFYRLRAGDVHEMRRVLLTD